MGMFDELVCDAFLPAAPPWVGPGTVFQTKSLDRDLDRYRITGDGRLLLTHRMGNDGIESRDELREPERMYPEHGIVFYDYDDASAEMCQFKASFDFDGRLCSIVRMPDR